MKLALSRTLLLEREILFLDEPTIGLDINTVNLFIDLIKNFKGTVILTSHNFAVAENLCDRIAFINEGKIIKIGTIEEVKQLSGAEIILEITLNKADQKLISNLKEHNFFSEKVERKNKILVKLKTEKII